MCKVQAEKKTFALDAECIAFLKENALQKGTTQAKIVNDAIRLLRDKEYMNDKAYFINDDIKEFTAAAMNMLETKLNAKSNQLISSLAIQQAVMAQMLADGLEVSPDALERYRKNGAEFIKTNNRVLDMKDVL